MDLPQEQININPILKTEELMVKDNNELIEIAKKLQDELQTKNKILLDLKTKEAWLQSELVVYKQIGKPDDIEGENTTLAFDFLKNATDKFSKEEAMEARSQLFKSLLSFKKQLAQAEQITHRNNELLKEAERKRKAAQEEVFYLNSVISQISSKEPSLYREISDRQTLKKKLDESEDIINNLRAKLNSWTKASKRNLEARHIAETCTKTMEGELETYIKAFEEVKAREDAYESRVQELEATILTSGLTIPPDTNQLPTGNEERKNQILQIKELE